MDDFSTITTWISYYLTSFNLYCFCWQQIVATGDSDTDSFALQTENLSSILSKVPQGTKVAVVSVVGAFRTGKSFLLNFFLRYLRCSVNPGDLSEDWMTVDGKLLLHDIERIHRSFEVFSETSMISVLIYRTWD